MPASWMPSVAGRFKRAWQQGAGPADGPLTIDMDSTICQVYGTHKQGVQFGYTKGVAVTYSHLLLAFAAGTWDLLGARLRGGSASTAQGAAGFGAETTGRVRAAGASGPQTFRLSGRILHERLCIVTAAKEIQRAANGRRTPCN
jgi:hypothetical protein